MLARMTSEQFNEWRAKDLIEPIGQTGTHEILIRLAMMISAMAGSEDATERMFAPWRTEAKPEENTEAIFKTLEAVAGAVRT